MKRSRAILSILLGLTIIVGCNSVPDGVLPKEKMAQLLADMHIGESIVDAEHTKYYSDSLKKTVKQSILVGHGVTQEELDSSFAWYGRNIEEYIEVYDRVIEILNEDLTRIGAGKEEKVTISLEGDSVDTWQGTRYYTINHNSASRYITFRLSKDRNWENGDCYIWRMKLINNITPVKWGIVADYADGTTEYTNSTAYNEGWNDIKLITDSTKSLNRIYGYMYVSPKDGEQIYLDSISLVRMRVNRDYYHQRSMQKKFDYGKNKPTDTDAKKNKSDEKTISEPKLEESKAVKSTQSPLTKSQSVKPIVNSNRSLPISRHTINNNMKNTTNNGNE